MKLWAVGKLATSEDRDTTRKVSTTELSQVSVRVPSDAVSAIQAVAAVVRAQNLIAATEDNTEDLDFEVACLRRTRGYAMEQVNRIINGADGSESDDEAELVASIEFHRDTYYGAWREQETFTPSSLEWTRAGAVANAHAAMAAALGQLYVVNDYAGGFNE